VLDTSAIVALLCPWHEHHRQVTASTTERLKKAVGFGIAAHSLVEAYAVLTRLPAPYRLSCADALELLRQNFGAAKLAALTAARFWTLLDRAALGSIRGGRTYDALIAATVAELVPCDLLTLNAQHFAGWDAPGITVVDLVRAS
jgi:predicted nucleic acid-binding protein